VPEELWTVQAHEIIQNFQLANLSESYDKGSVGIRKMLSTAASAVLEYPVRGVFGGAERIERKDDDYDLEDAQDLERAFRDFLNGYVGVFPFMWKAGNGMHLRPQFSYLSSSKTHQFQPNIYNTY